jgi:hypothetical protein
VKRRTPILALHHPIHNPSSRIKTLVEGLVDAADLEVVVAPLESGMLLHGHLHNRMQRAFPTRAGRLLAVGATSASLHHDDEHRMAGFNLYEFDGAGGLLGVEAHVFDPQKDSFRIDRVPTWD